MLVKTFEADSMSQALKMVKEELGPDALIISSRSVRRNGLGLLGKPRVEITAAIDSDDHEQPRMAAEAVPSASRPQATAKLANAVYQRQSDWRQAPVIDPLEEELRELKQLLLNQDIAGLRNELNELKASMHRSPQQEQPAPSSRPAPRASKHGSDEARLQALVENLTRFDIHPDTATTLASYAGEKLTPQQMSNPALIERFFSDTIADLLRFCDPTSSCASTQTRIALIGPTGVGKTTTIAKLAADQLQHSQAKIALFTIDTYRVAAVEQLKVYAEIMKLPLEVIYSPDKLQEAFDRHADKDLILIDTSGRSPRDEAGLRELEAFLCRDGSIQNHLVLSAGTRDQELSDSVNAFGRFSVDSLIFTKLDECQLRGALLELPLRQNLPLSYLTNGQRVPEDILTAEPNLVAGYIFGKH